MSSSIVRKRGDNYPIGFVFTVNGEAVDLTGNVIKFSFRDEEHDTTTTIIGTLDGEVTGRGVFSPTVEEMSVTGQYVFDFQREINGVIYTHASGTMLLQQDVTP